MSSIGAQKQVIDGVASVKYITSALRDISVVELKKVRAEFHQNAMFYEELQFLYQLVWRIAVETGNEYMLNAKRHQHLHVAYTTNKHFYGSLNQDVMSLFTKSTDTKDVCVILGTTGGELWRNAVKRRKEARLRAFDDDEPTEEEIVTFLESVKEYSRVFVYYPKFVSVYEQSAGVIDITFRPTKAQLRAQKNVTMPEYFLEPDLGEMLAFFNGQVRYILFKRMLLETRLSRVAARLVRMDMADHNAADVLVQEQRELGRAYRSFFNSRMLETLTGFAQWHKTNK